MYQKLICVGFNDIHLLFFCFCIFMISCIIYCIIFFVCFYLSLCENLY